MLRAALRSLFARKVRLLLTGLSIVLGVGFVAGTYVLTDTMTAAFDDIIQTGSTNLDVLVRAENAFDAEFQGGGATEERKPMQQTVTDTVLTVDGVAEVYGDVFGFAQMVDPATDEPIGTFGPPTLGGSWSEIGAITIREGTPPSGPDQVVIDAGTAERYSIQLGDRMEVLFEGAPGEFEVVGLAAYGESDSLLGATIALFDLATAQQRLGKVGQLDTISVVAEAGVSAIELQRRIGAALPEGVEAITAATYVSEQQDQVQQGLGFFRTALLVFAFVALFVGSFIIFNTFAIIVAQRTRELGLLRALGASSRQVMTSVVLEAILVGVVASAIGVVVGIGIAIGLQALLSGIGLELPGSATVIQVRTVVVSIVIGTLITVIASVVPARRAARVTPIQALRETQDHLGRSLRFRLISGLVVLGLGVVPVLYGLFGTPENGLQLVGVGVLLTFIGVAMLTPLIARPVAGTLGAPLRRTGLPGKLGRENAMRNPRRTAATASALMIGLGLVVFVAVFGQSAKASTDAVLQRTLKADFILSSPSLSGFSTAAAHDLRSVPGVLAVSEIRQSSFRVEGVAAFATSVDPAFEATSDAGVIAGSLDSLGLPGTIAVHEDAANDNGWSVGDTIDVSFAATGDQQRQIVAIYAEKGIIDDYGISLEDYRDNFANQLDIMVLVKARDGANVTDLRRSMESALESYPNIEIQDQAEFREKWVQFLNQILNLLTALLLMAVIIAVFGIVNTLSLSIYERTRELGLLRAVGMSRRQTRSMVRWEAVIIAVMGAVFGVVIGIAFGWALQQALEPEGFTELGIPGGQLVFYVVLAGLAGVLAAILPARRAARLNVLEAISYE
ncbi:MAG TPA: FtsX-like permease family protein [Actinomycetota bacterium]|nr:FtsX-like permease family protein [Actinomycetota bacterium]